MKRSREESSFGLFNSHTKSCDPDGARSLEIHSNVISNWSSLTGFAVIAEQIDTSFEELAIEKAIVKLPSSGDKNEDFNVVTEYVDVIGNCKNDLPINVIATSDLNTITIGINDDLSVICDQRSVNPNFSHHVTCSNICEQQPSSDMVPSIYHEGEIELDLALEGLRGISTDRVLDPNR